MWVLRWNAHLYLKLSTQDVALLTSCPHRWGTPHIMWYSGCLFSAISWFNPTDAVGKEAVEEKKGVAVLAIIEATFSSTSLHKCLLLDFTKVYQRLLQWLVVLIVKKQFWYFRRVPYPDTLRTLLASHTRLSSGVYTLHHLKPNIWFTLTSNLNQISHECNRMFDVTCRVWTQRGTVSLMLKTPEESSNFKTV